MLYSSNPTTTYGSALNLQAGAFSAGSQFLHSVLKFDVSSLTGQTISSATIDVEVRSSSNAPITINAHRLTTNWTEGSVTWNSPWSAAGGDYDPTVVGSASFTSNLSLGDPTETMSIDITDLVQGWIDGTYPNYGLVLRDASGTARSINCYTKEGLVAPKLAVVSCSGGGSGSSSATFTQMEPMCTDLDMPAGGVVQVTAYVQGSSSGTTTTVTSRVNQSSDDAEENVSGGSMDLTSSDLELISDGGTDQLVGIRFNNITIPQGAIISSANIEFETDELDSGPTSLTISGEDVDNAVSFSTSLGNISARTKTTASVSWNNVPAWNTVDEKHQTPDISAIIQEIVDRGGWSDGNSIVLILEGSGERTAEAFDGEPSAAPLLTIEYSTGGNALPPNPDVTAILKHGSTTFATLTNPVYNSSDSTFIWNKILGSDYTIPAGQEISLQIIKNDSGYVFDLLYDSQTKPSKIDLPTQTIIVVEELGLYDASYAGGTAIDGAENGETVFIRTRVSDPFGPEDVTSLNLIVTSPSDSILVDTILYDAHVVATMGCEKIYEFAWKTGVEQGIYHIDVVAHEGYEGITDEASTEIEISFDDFGSPCQVEFSDGTNTVTTYDPNDVICVQVTDIDENKNATTAETITATLRSASNDSETLTLTETGVNTGVFTFCMPSSSTVVGSSGDGTLYASMGDLLTLRYTDPDISADECNTTALINSVNPDVDIAIQLIEPADGVAVVGEHIRFDITISNPGPTTLTSMLVNSTFNTSQLTYTGSSLSPNVIMSGSLIWNLTTPIPPGGTYVIEVYFTGAAPANPAYVNASVSGNDENAEPVSAGPVNDDVIIANPLIAVDKFLTDPLAGPYVMGDTLIFQIDISNIGTSNITYLPLMDEYSAGCLTFVDAIPAANGAGGGAVIWENLGPLASSATTSVTTRFVISGICSPIENIASVTLAEDENGVPVPPAQDTVSFSAESAPIAENDLDSTGIGQPRTIFVLVNDSDFNFNLDTSSITTTGVLQPVNGTITGINTATGEITYQPNAGFTGVDHFEYIICDLTNLCDTALVTIVILNEDCSNGIDDDGDGLIDCDDPDCTNFSGGGSLGGNEEKCGSYDPTEIISLSLPSGGTGGGFEFYWEYSVNGGLSWLIVPGATGATYDPPTITQTFWFRRAARRFTCDGWVFSNICLKSVTACPEICDNGLDDDGDGLIDCEDESCVPVVTVSGNISICMTDTTTISVSASGGLPPYVYIWDSSLGEGQSHSVSPDTTTTYRVMVLSSTGCIGIDSVTISVVPCPEDCQDGIDNDGDGLIDCDDPDCQLVGQPVLNPDYYNTCPGVIYTDQVTFNDNNLQQPLFSILEQPVRGTVSINHQGVFTYIPNAVICDVDSFTYQVCNQVSGCCDDTKVYLNAGDTIAPVLQNIPADLTIGCDESLPDIPALVYALDACPGIYVTYYENSTQQLGNACQNYTISRIWEATDRCGNTAIDSQLITVIDVSAPEIFRLYTLANGKRVAGGVSQKTTNNWKYIEFPFNFAEVPLIFPQVITVNEASAVTVRIRNVSEEGFELRLQEEEISDGIHAQEQVAWMAIEPGNLTQGFKLQSGLLPAVNSSNTTINFSSSFVGLPAFIATMQTFNEKDPAAIRVSSLSQNSASIFIQEEKSKDTEIIHANEKVAYLAMNVGTLTDKDGTEVGETGSLSVGNNWKLVQLSQTYNKPVVILGGIETGDDPAVIRVRNVTPTSFEVKVQDWDYLNPFHPVQKISYIVMEGSITSAADYFCDQDRVELIPNINLFAIDNCDNQLAFTYFDSSEYRTTGLHVYRNWTATDDCGNSTTVLRTDTCVLAAARIKLFVIGSSLSFNTQGLMKDDLRVQGLIPLVEPYSGHGGFKHYGTGGGETTTQEILNVTGPNAVVDWVFLEVRDAANPKTIRATKSVLLQRDGDLVSAAGQDTIFFEELPEENYHISVRHRNHLGMMMTPSSYLTTDDPVMIDFSNDENILLGLDEAAGRNVFNKRAMWVGDLNGDKRAIFQGPANDIFILFSAILASPDNENHLANFILPGYLREDLNMDGKAILQGPNNDKTILLYNTILKHPSNTSNLSNYIVSEKLP